MVMKALATNGSWLELLNLLAKSSSTQQKLTKSKKAAKKTTNLTCFPWVSDLVMAKGPVRSSDRESNAVGSLNALSRANVR